MKRLVMTLAIFAVVAGLATAWTLTRDRGPSPPTTCPPPNEWQPGVCIIT